MNRHPSQLSLQLRPGSLSVHLINAVARAVARALIAGGGGVYSYICVMPYQLFLKPVVIRVNFKRN